MVLKLWLEVWEVCIMQKMCFQKFSLLRIRNYGLHMDVVKIDGVI